MRRHWPGAPECRRGPLPDRFLNSLSRLARHLHRHRHRLRSERSHVSKKQLSLRPPSQKPGWDLDHGSSHLRRRNVAKGGRRFGCKRPLGNWLPECPMLTQNGNPSMPETPPLRIFDNIVDGSTQAAGQSVDEGKGRILPCEGCGADLTFHIFQS